MTLKRRFRAGSAVGIVLTTSLALAQAHGTDEGKTGYAPVNRLKMYYEMHGSGATTKRPQ